MKEFRDAKREGRHGKVLNACSAEYLVPLLRDGFDFLIGQERTYGKHGDGDERRHLIGV